MRAVTRELRWGALGVLGGVAAVVAGRCGGGACTSCFACAVPGAAFLLAALGRRPGAPADGAVTAAPPEEGRAAR